MSSKITNECRDSLLSAMEEKLDTRDKRFMFLKMEFKELVSRIDLEGSAHQTAWNIFVEFEKQCMLGSLIACLNSKLNTDILLTTNPH